MKKVIISTIFAAIAAVPAMALDISLDHKGPGLRVLTVKEAPEGFGRGLPMGPAALRYDGESLWAIDSIAGSFVEYDGAGKALRSLKIDGADRMVIADFAFEKNAEGKTSAIWAVGSEQTDVVRIDPEGKVVGSFSTGLGMPARIELLPGGKVAVFDQGIPAVVAFDAAGTKLWQQEAIGKGFKAEANGDILFLAAKGDNVFVCRRSDADGKVVELLELPVSQDSNPTMLLSRDNGEILVGFHSLSEETGEIAYNISRMSLSGKPMASVTTDFPAPFINRVIVEKGEALFLVNFIEENDQYILRLSDFAPEMIEEAAQG
jgi:hypothetical protein